MHRSYHRVDKTNEPEAAPRKAGYHHGDLRSARLHAAQTLLEEHGVAGFTLAECARRAGVSKTAPSHHFANVGGLLGAIATMGIDELADRMEAALAPAGADASARLRAIATAYVDFALDRPERFRLMFGPVLPAYKHGEPLTARTDRALKTLEREVAALRSERRSARALTVFTWSFVHGLAMLLLEDRLALVVDAQLGEKDREAMVSEAVELLAFV